MGECISCKIIPGVSDHVMLLCSMKLPMFFEEVVCRECFSYSKANWKQLNQFFYDTKHNLDYFCELQASSSKLPSEHP